MQRRNQYLLIAIAAVIIAVILVMVGLASAQRRTVQPQHWIPLIRQEQEPASPVANIGLIYVDPNGDACYKDIDGKKSIFAGDSVTFNINNLAIDGNVIYVDGVNDTVGFFTTTPAAEAGIQYSDKFVICDTFTSAGIDACIDALGSEGGEVYLPEGTYLFSTEVYDTTAGITIRGAGYSTIILIDANQTWSLNEHLFELTGAGCCIRDLRIDGQQDSVNLNSDTSAIYLGTGGLVENVYFFETRGTGTGLVIVGNYGQVRRCTFDSCGNGTGSYLLASWSSLGHIIYSNNVFHDNEPAIADICLRYFADDCLVSNNFFYNETGDHAAIMLDGVDSCQISNNIINGVPTGIVVKTYTSIPLNNSITGNYIYQAEDYGIYIASGENHVIKDNYIYDTDPSGTDIYINTYNVQITSNFVSGYGASSGTVPKYGIFLDVSARSLNITGNTIKYHGIASIYGQHCSDIQISGNQFAVQNFVIPPSTTAENYIIMDPNCENIGIWGNSVYDPNNVGPIINNAASHGDFEIYAQVGIDVDPDDNAYFQVSDKYIVCKTFTSAGINACIDALGAEGGEVYLPEGEYAITTQVTIDYSNTTIRGAGAGTILKMAADVSGIYAGLGKDNIILRDFCIDGNYIDMSSSNGCIEIDQSDQTLVSNVKIYNYEEIAINIDFYVADDNSHFVTIKDSIFENTADSSSYAIYNNEIVYTQVTLNVLGCNFNSIDKGINVNYAKVNIESCRFYNLGDGSIYLTANRGSSIINCFFIDNDSPEIYAGSNLWNSIISENTFYNSGGYSIQGSFIKCLITNNTFAWPANIDSIILLSGVGGDDPSSGIISDNTFILEANDADYCIKFDGGDNFTVSNNIFDEEVDIAAVYMDSSDIGNIFYGNQNLTFAGANRVYGDIKIAGIPEFYGAGSANGTLRLWTHQTDSLADDGTVNLPDATDGMVIVSITDPNSSFTDECALFMVTNGGVVSKVSGTTNTDDADTDATLCVYDGGTYGVIKNRMGDVGALRAFYFYQ